MYINIYYLLTLVVLNPIVGHFLLIVNIILDFRVFSHGFKYRSIWWYAETLIFVEVVRAVKGLRTTDLDIISGILKKIQGRFGPRNL